MQTGGRQHIHEGLGGVVACLPVSLYSSPHTVFGRVVGLKPVEVEMK